MLRKQNNMTDRLDCGVLKHRRGNMKSYSDKSSNYLSRLRGACVLMIGLGGLATEVCKNIVLVGVNSLTIMDSTVLSSEDSANRFLCTKEGISVSGHITIFSSTYL